MTTVMTTGRVLSTIQMKSMTMTMPITDTVTSHPDRDRVCTKKNATGTILTNEASVTKLVTHSVDSTRVQVQGTELTIAHEVDLTMNPTSIETEPILSSSVKLISLFASFILFPIKTNKQSKKCLLLPFIQEKRKRLIGSKLTYFT